MERLQISLDRQQAAYVRHEAEKLAVSRIEIIRRALEAHMHRQSARHASSRSLTAGLK